MAAEIGKSFLFYFEWMDILKGLSDQEVGMLIRALNAYAQDKEFKPLNGMALMAFEFMKNQLDRDKEKYRKRAERSRTNGLMGGRPKANKSDDEANKNPENPTGYLGCNENPKEPEKPDKVKDKVEVEDKVKVEDKVEDKVEVEVEDKDNIYIPHKSPLKGEKISSTSTGKAFSSDKASKLSEICSAVIAHLNEKAGTNYRVSSRKTKSLISARSSEGYTLDDFKTVIDKKCDEWRGTDYEKYIRPTTLFGTKFEDYLHCPASRKTEYGPAGIRLEDIENRDELEELFSL